MTAVFGEIFASTSLGSSVWLSCSTSANTGTAPAWQTEKEVAMKVYDGTMTSSPGPTPSPASAVCRALVPLLVATPNSAPHHFAHSRSNSMPSDPVQ